MYRKGREIVKRAGRTHRPGPPALSQSVSSDSEEHPVVLTQEVRINGGIFTSAGRDVHTHFYTAPKPEQPQFDLWSVLEPIENFRQIQQDTLSKATPKTGEWIFDYEMFPIWWDPKSDLKTLWGSGIPGAGKTVATSIVVNGIEKWAEEQGSPVCVCYIYLRYSDSSGLTVSQYLEILVRQTVEKHPNCFKLAEKVYASHVRLKTRPTEDELFQLLKSFTALTSATFYFLDALDEAPVNIQYDLIKKVSSLKVKLFITSRPMGALAARFPDSHSFCIAAHERDLELHINLEIDRSYDLCGILLEADPSLRAEIISSVKANCGGMFLHASLQMAALRECTSLYDVKHALNNFPAQIEDVYFDTWRRINDQPLHKRLLAQHCLLWVLNAVRSMKVDELRYAVAIVPQTFQLDPDRLVSADAMVSSCRGLLAVDEATRLVRLVHYTAKDTLERLMFEISPRPHSILTSVCVVCLVDHGFQDWKDESPFANPFFRKDDSPFSETLSADPLLAYAYEAWTVHARSSLCDASERDRVTQFLKECRAFPVEDGLFSMDLLGPLHLAASFDLPIVLAGFDQTTDQDPNSVTEHGESPLHIACNRNSLSTMKELLQLPQIFVNATNWRGHTPLMLATETGNENAVKLLLTHPETDVNAEDGEHGDCALTMATRLGFPGIVNLLLAHPLINVNVVDREGQTPLVWAVKGDHTATVEYLVAHSLINVNLGDEEGRTPLIWAAKDRREVSLKALLAHSQIDLNLVDKEGQTALDWALQHGREEISNLLLACFEFIPSSNSRSPQPSPQTPACGPIPPLASAPAQPSLPHPHPQPETNDTRASNTSQCQASSQVHCHFLMLEDTVPTDPDRVPRSPLLKYTLRLAHYFWGKRGVQVEAKGGDGQSFVST